MWDEWYLYFKARAHFVDCQKARLQFPHAVHPSVDEMWKAWLLLEEILEAFPWLSEFRPPETSYPDHHLLIKLARFVLPNHSDAVNDPWLL